MRKRRVTLQREIRTTFARDCMRRSSGVTFGVDHAGTDHARGRRYCINPFDLTRADPACGAGVANGLGMSSGSGNNRGNKKSRGEVAETKGSVQSTGRVCPGRESVISWFNQYRDAEYFPECHQTRGHAVLARCRGCRVLPGPGRRRTHVRSSPGYGRCSSRSYVLRCESG